MAFLQWYFTVILFTATMLSKNLINGTKNRVIPNYFPDRVVSSSFCTDFCWSKFASCFVGLWMRNRSNSSWKIHYAQEGQILSIEIPKVQLQESHRREKKWRSWWWQSLSLAMSALSSKSTFLTEWLSLCVFFVFVAMIFIKIYYKMTRCTTR